MMPPEWRGPACSATRLQMASEGPLPQDRSDDLLADDLRRDASRQGHKPGADSAFASVPGLLNRHDWRAAGSTGLLANVDVVVAHGSHARY